MEKPGGPKGAPRHLKPEKPDRNWIGSNPKGDPKVARMARQRKRCLRPFPTFCAGNPTFPCVPGEALNPWPRPVRHADAGGRRDDAQREEPHSCNCRFSDSTSSDSATSLATRASILRTACSTVVWSRPPNRRPISGSERKVSVFARYIATWRGRTTLAVRRDDNRSERLTLYCRATTR